MKRKKEIVYIGCKASRTMKLLIEKHILMDTHQNLSEFLREAIREKIRRETPQLYNELFARGG